MAKVILLTRKMGWALFVIGFFTMTLLFVLCLWTEKADAHSLVYGNALLKTCSSENEIKITRCLHYVVGVLDGISFQRGFTKGTIGSSTTYAVHGPTLKHYCFPDGVTNGQVVLILQEYMLDHPEQLHDTSVALIRRALKAAFPCIAEVTFDIMVHDLVE